MESFQVDLGLDTLPVRLDWTVECTRRGADCELVTLVAIIFRVLHKVTVTRSLTVHGADIGQTHLGSLEGKSTIIAWKLASRCKYVKQFANITDPPTLSPPLPI